MRCLLLWILCAGWALGAVADDQLPESAPKPPPEPRRPALEELRKRNPEGFDKLREELRNLPPEERQKRMRELREMNATPLRGELEKRREELKDLPPAERQARMKAFREEVIERRKAMTEDERRAKRGEIKLRFDRQLAELRGKKTNGPLTALEARRLQRLETLEQRFKEARSENAGAPPPKNPEP